MIYALRKVISIQGDRLVTRFRSRMGGEHSTRFVWVAKSGDDPRAWFRPDARFNQAPWRQGRFPEDGLLVPLEDIQEAKRRILDRIHAQLAWRHSKPALESQGERPLRALRFHQERRQYRERIQVRLKRLDLAERQEDADPRIRQVLTEAIIPEFDRDLRADLELLEGSLPDGSPFQRRAYRRQAFTESISGYRPSDAELRYRQTLIERWRRLHELEQWLSLFPAGALDFVHRHEFPEHRWHLLNLWIRVPEGRELFDEIPALAAALASAWRFRGRPDPNHFRSIRRLIRRKRVEVLRWLDFPPRKSTLKLLKSLPPDMMNVRALLDLREVLERGRYPADLLATLPHPVDTDLMFLMLRRTSPSIPILRAIAGKGAKGKEVYQLYFDADLMAQLLEQEEAGPWRQRLGRVRGPGGLRETHDAMMLVFRQHQISDDELFQAFVKSKARIPPPFPGTATIHPLDTAEAIHTEAVEMHHCLDSYFQSISAGNYFAYSVRLDEERATLGVRRIASDFREVRPNRWLIDQLQGAKNRPVSDELADHVRDWFRNATSGSPKAGAAGPPELSGGVLQLDLAIED